MRILILSCSTGEGHNSAGRALCEAFVQHGVACQMRDFLDMLPSPATHLIREGNLFLYKHAPRLFGWGYRMELEHPSGILRRICLRGMLPLEVAIREGAYDAVICVHPFPAMALSELRRTDRIRTAAYYVATDYTCHPDVEGTHLDGYFIPHHTLRSEFTAHGIPAERLFATGIPVHPSFSCTRTREQVCAELQLPPTHRILLMACGSIGCGPIKRITRRLLDDMPQNTTLVVICGQNTRLCERLRRMTAGDARVRVLGYTRRMSDYMDIADVFLTKAGGLCTTEAIVKRLPLIYVHAVPGCEQRNALFGTRFGYALRAHDMREACRLACLCLRDVSVRERLRHTMCRMFPRTGAVAICRHVLAQYRRCVAPSTCTE